MQTHTEVQTVSQGPLALVAPQQSYPQNYRAFLQAQWRERRMRQAAKAAEFQRREAEAHQSAVQQKSLDEEPISDQSLAECCPQPIEKFFSNPYRIENIQAIVADFYAISRADILGTRQLRRVARPRMIAMFLSRELTNKSWSELGRRFCRDHSTIIDNCTAIGTLIAANPLIAADVAACKAKIEARR